MHIGKKNYDPPNSEIALLKIILENIIFGNSSVANLIIFFACD